MTKLKHILLLSLTSLVLIALFPGCRTSSDPANEASRPWNSPRGWEHGLPTGINEGR